MNDTVIRQAALIVASLDPPEADALLDRFPAAQAQRIRYAVMDLGPIDPVEQRLAVRAFVAGDRLPRSTSAGVELDLNSTRASDAPHPRTAERRPEADDRAPKASGSHPGVISSPNRTTNGEDDSPSFPDLQQVPAAELARWLTDEHPQTVAMILTNLPPSQAFQVLQTFTTAQRVDLLRRIARTRSPHPDVIREVGLAIGARIAQRQADTVVGSAGLTALQAILQTATDDDRQRLVGQLLAADSQLRKHLHAPLSNAESPRTGSMASIHQPRHRSAAEPSESESSVSAGKPASNGSIGTAPADTVAAHSRATSPPASEAGPREPGLKGPSAEELGAKESRSQESRSMVFGDLEQLADADLARVFRAADPEVVRIALAGASPAFAERILSRMPRHEARQLERHMEQIGPLRLADIEQAQQQLAEVADRLGLHTQRPPGTGQRFTVAA